MNLVEIGSQVSSICMTFFMIASGPYEEGTVLPIISSLISCFDLNIDVPSSSLIAENSAQLIAEIAKTDEGRSMLSDTEVLQFILKIFIMAVNSAKTGIDPIKVQCLRATANLCFNSDINRDLVAESPDAIHCLAVTLKSTNDVVVYNTLGCLLNASMDSGNFCFIQDSVQLALLREGTLESIIMILQNGDHCNCSKGTSNDAKYGMAIRTINNLIEPEAGLNAFVETGAIDILFVVLKQWHKDILKADESPESFYMVEGLVLLLETISEMDTIQKILFCSDKFFTLSNIINNAPSFVMKEGDDQDTNFGSIRKIITNIVTNVTMCGNAYINIRFIDDAIGRKRECD